MPSNLPKSSKIVLKVVNYSNCLTNAANFRHHAINNPNSHIWSFYCTLPNRCSTPNFSYFTTLSDVSVSYQGISQAQKRDGVIAAITIKLGLLYFIYSIHCTNTSEAVTWQVRYSERELVTVGIGYALGQWFLTWVRSKPRGVGQGRNKWERGPGQSRDREAP